MMKFNTSRLKAYFFQSRVWKQQSYMKGSVIAGISAFVLIFMGSMNILDNPLISISQILYGFGVLLPLAYYQRQMAERMGEQ